MATSTGTDYRVVSLSEAGNDMVTVNFVEVVANTTGAAPGPYGNFSRTFKSADAAEYFPGQIYTMTLTKK